MDDVVVANCLVARKRAFMVGVLIETEGGARSRCKAGNVIEWQENKTKRGVMKKCKDSNQK